MARPTTKTGDDEIKVSAVITAKINEKLKARAKEDRRSVGHYLALLIERDVEPDVLPAGR